MMWRTAKKLIKLLKAGYKKITNLLNSSLLTDSSQARKTKDDKELVLARIEVIRLVGTTDVYKIIAL